jgi:hypothetical protein
MESSQLLGDPNLQPRSHLHSATLLSFQYQFLQMKKLVPHRRDEFLIFLHDNPSKAERLQINYPSE